MGEQLPPHFPGFPPNNTLKRISWLVYRPAGNPLRYVTVAFPEACQPYKPPIPPPPLAPEYPHNSPYAFSENKVIRFIELEGLETADPFEGMHREESPENLIIPIVEGAIDLFKTLTSDEVSQKDKVSVALRATLPVDGLNLLFKTVRVSTGSNEEFTKEEVIEGGADILTTSISIATGYG